MEFGDLSFYILDLIVFIMLALWTNSSRKVKVAAKVGARWLVPLFFAIVAVYGFFKYTGTFRWVQTIVLLIFGAMYYFLKSGLSDDGVVSNGTVTKWENAGTITYSRNENCIYYRFKKQNSAMYFDPEKMTDVRKFLAARSIKTSTDKSKIQ